MMIPSHWIRTFVTGSLTFTLVVGGLVGCENLPSGGPNRFSRKPVKRTRFRTDISRISIMVMTPLLDRNSNRRLDGVLVRMYAYCANEDRPVAAKGPMRIYLFKRHDGSEDASSDQAVKIWKVSADELARSLHADRFGFTCHLMELHWQEGKVTGPGIYIRGEFIRPDDRVVLSKPLSLYVPAAAVSQK